MLAVCRAEVLMKTINRLFALILFFLTPFAFAHAETSQPKFIHCYSDKPGQELQIEVFANLNPSFVEYNIVIIGLQSEPTRWAKRFRIRVGKPDTRLFGLTLYYAGRRPNPGLHIYMNTAPTVSGSWQVYTGRGILYIGNDNQIHLTCGGV
jgi:hypothetical protein